MWERQWWACMLQQLPPNLHLPSPSPPSSSSSLLPLPLHHTTGKTQVITALPKPLPDFGQLPPVAILPSGSSEHHWCFPLTASHCPTLWACCCCVPPYPNHGLSMGLGVVARDRVPSASLGRREAVSCVLCPAPAVTTATGDLAASASRDRGGEAQGVWAHAAGHFQLFCILEEHL